jgi:hypothetical protein
MAVDALHGKRPSFMHDLESFFWVLFWVCVHYTAPGKGRVVEQFDEWNHMDACSLGVVEAGHGGGGEDFPADCGEAFYGVL